MWPSHTLHCLQCSLAPGLTTSRAGSGCRDKRTSCLSPTRSCSRLVWGLPLAFLPQHMLLDPCQLPTSSCTGKQNFWGPGDRERVTIGRWSKSTQDQMKWPPRQQQGKASSQESLQTLSQQDQESLQTPVTRRANAGHLLLSTNAPPTHTLRPLLPEEGREETGGLLEAGRGGWQTCSWPARDTDCLKNIKGKTKSNNKNPNNKRKEKAWQEGSVGKSAGCCSRDLTRFPAPAWWLTIACNSGFR